MEAALFGAGRIGKIHAGNLVKQPGVSLRYVVDVDPAAAARSRSSTAPRSPPRRKSSRTRTWAWS